MRVLKFSIFVFAAIALSAFCIAQKKVSLIVAEYDDNASVNHLQHVVNYTFLDGAMVSREELLAIPTQKAGVKGNYIRFDIGKNKLYRNRYIVTGIGNIIDIKNKKVLLEEKDEFIAFSGDSVIFYTNDIFKGKYYSVFNLKTEKYQKVENANYNPLPRPTVEVDDTGEPFVINAYATSGKKETLVKDAGYGEAQPLIGDNVKRKFPVFWLDNKNFLYANFTKNQHMASIYKVGTDKSIEKIADIDEIPATAENTSFEYDAAGNVIYTCGKGKFMIDMKKKKAEPVVFETVGNNFFVESAENAKYGRAIKFESTETGKKWCRVDNAQTTSGYAAFQTDMVVGTDRYPQGVAVWNSTTKKWTNLDVSSLANIIGWVSE
ncbi:MAG: hypothetical protein JWO44_1709 [Bacteroidetes bacterium]|nr:hypothetical protein [Bacteroidota bacterium]